MKLKIELAILLLFSVQLAKEVESAARWAGLWFFALFLVDCARNSGYCFPYNVL